MLQAVFRVDFGSLPDDDDFELDRVTEELADDLRSVGEVERSTMSAAPGSKGTLELALGSLSLLAGTDPAIVQSIVDLLVGFLSRNKGRTVRLRVADVDLTLEQPTRAEAAEVIRIARAAIERLPR
ncbi:hypothetical protein [Actinoplanes sp. NPDC051494]|uniref:hypothetical protein n=1 Tax=Actinoplanes sp. NPDC051494 TaxID=3363907 RepID=UPI0037A1A1BA